jgi:mutator protein MutT
MKAAAVIITKGNKILLAKRSKNLSEEPNKWENMGGSVDSGETFEQAIRREAKEELGVELINLQTLIEHRNNEGEVTVTLFSATVSSEPQILEPDACDEINWVERSELANYDLAKFARQDFVKLGWI